MGDEREQKDDRPGPFLFDHAGLVTEVDRNRRTSTGQNQGYRRQSHAAVKRSRKRLDLRLRHLLRLEERVLRAEGVAVEETLRAPTRPRPALR